jgi:hypothetical protein
MNLNILAMLGRVVFCYWNSRMCRLFGAGKFCKKASVGG